MKTRFILPLFLLTAALIFSSCVKEGPEGLAGTDGQDGADGQDGNVTCLACHSGTALAEKQIQYAASIHKAGTNVAYAGGRASCAECHSSEGYIEMHTMGSVAANIESPSAITCNTCHMIHTDFEYTDYALRGNEPVALKYDPSNVLDLGDGSNVCLNCHQSRTAEPNLAKPGEATFSITSTHYGPHHGPQGNLFDGNGFAEVAGPVAYPVAGSSPHREQASCITCHMGEYADGEGDHTWKASVASCNDCHSTEDFNYGGIQTLTQLRLDELRDILVDLGVIEWVEADASYEPVVGTYPMVQAQAYFNWIGITEDRSLGVHNPKYVNALLTNTIEALQPAK